MPTLTSSNWARKIIVVAFKPCSWVWKLKHASVYDCGYGKLKCKYQFTVYNGCELQSQQPKPLHSYLPSCYRP